jgi:transcriptional regulator with PAS, ATPase and Fis domain
LVTGETGTGKSILSGTLHFNSTRRDKPFIKITCANIPETLLESELFGHEKGSFTGANKTRVGRLEQANGGTVFLDEIGELSPALQAKFLRVLEDKSFERLGGDRTIHSDIRIITATNRNLEDQVAEKTFREDLFYRINVLRVHLPPLRERTECIEPLAYHLLQKICRTVKKRVDGFSPEVINHFKTYPWPGNIRELSNVIERAAIIEDSYIIQRESVSLPEPRSAPHVEPFRQALQLDDNEKSLIQQALDETLWIQKDAAARLGITPRILNYKIKKYGITHPRWRKNR